MHYCSLVARSRVLLVASPATADYRDHDPDDTATSFDIRSVSSTVSPNRRLLFRSTFYDVLEWNANSFVWVYIDSRAGPSYDFLLDAGVRHDRAHCYFYSRHSLIGPTGVRVGPRRVTCTVARRRRDRPMRSDGPYAPSRVPGLVPGLMSSATGLRAGSATGTRTSKTLSMSTH